MASPSGAASSPREVVIDTNVAGAWSFAEEFSPEARIVKAAIDAGAIRGVVPELFWAEFQHVCVKKLVGDPRRGFVPLPRADVEAAYADLELLGLVEIPVLEELRDEALRLCLDLCLGSYDAYFLALAEVLGLPVWTFDREGFFERVAASPAHAGRIVLLQGITAIPST